MAHVGTILALAIAWRPCPNVAMEKLSRFVVACSIGFLGLTSCGGSGSAPKLGSGIADAGFLGLCSTDGGTGGAGGGAGQGGSSGAGGMAMGGSSGAGGSAGAGGGTAGAGGMVANSGGAVGSGGFLGTGGAAPMLAGTVANSSAAVNISAIGNVDWAHWQVPSATGPKVVAAGGPALISNYSVVVPMGQSPMSVQGYGNDPRTVSFTGGSPIASGSDTKGIYLLGAANTVGFGFSFLISGIGPTVETIDLYLGVYSGTGQLTCTPSDGRAALVLTTTPSGGNTSIDPHFQIQVSAASPGTSLFCTWLVSVNQGGANVTLGSIAISAVGGLPGSGGAGGSVGTGGATSTGGSVGTGGSGTGGAVGTGGSVGTGGAGGAIMGQNPSSSAGRYVAMVAPNNGETFAGPTTLRIVAAAHDPHIDTNSPSSGFGGDASRVDVYDGSTLIYSQFGNPTVPNSTPPYAEFWMFKGAAGPLAVGQHQVWARATFTNPTQVLDSLPATITVVDPPAYGQTVDLTADVAFGASGFSLVGTSTSRVRLNGHGFKISGTSATGALTLKFVDVFDLGPSSAPLTSGINVSTGADATIEDSAFYGVNATTLVLTGSATASIRRDVFASNSRFPIGQDPGEPSSIGAISISGTSTGTKVFAGNNVGAGWVGFSGANNWVIGGTTDADSNVLIGPRVGIFAINCTGMQIRRNYSHHVYYGGWSQGSNGEMFGTTASTLEHNIIYGSSWPVRGGGVGFEFRFNLVLLAGHEWMQPAPGSSVHHNVFVGGDQDQGGVFVFNNPVNPSGPVVNIANNTFDALGNNQRAIRLSPSADSVSLLSNAFLGYTGTDIVSLDAGTSGSLLTSDYNGFFPFAGAVYTDARTPAHDVRGTDAKIAQPRTTVFDADESAVWTRATSTASLLAAYRAQYTPQATSPLVGAGDPSVAGNWIGAVGNLSSTDGFGRP